MLAVIHHAAVLLIVASALFAVHAPAERASAGSPADRVEVATVSVTGKRLAKIDDRVFGQFMEKASWGEPGPEVALMPGANRLRPKAQEALRRMAPPLVRFPGGTDVERTLWYDAITHAPPRENSERPITVGKGGPITNRFGLDEFLTLREQLGFEPLLVVHLRDALAKTRPLKQVAEDAAAMVAYCNASAQQDLPEPLGAWRDARLKNGRRQPWNVRWFQIGNETWFYADEKLMKQAGIKTRKDFAEWYRQCVLTLIEAMLAVDPELRFIMDAPINDRSVLQHRAATDPNIRRHVSLLTFHEYFPTNMQRWAAKNPGREPLTDEQLWYAWVAGPGQFDDQGQIRVQPQTVQRIKALGYDAAITEWNWNGWGAKHLNPDLGIDPLQAGGLGAAGYLHGILRDSETIKVATQSMWIGHAWGITAIRVDPEGERDPYFLPQGIVSMLYRHHHGSHLLETKTRAIPQLENIAQVSWRKPPANIAVLDVVATGDSDGTIYLHVINRHLHNDQTLQIDWPNDVVAKSIRRRSWIATPFSQATADHQNRDPYTEQIEKVGDVPTRLTVPARSVSIYRVDTER